MSHSITAEGGTNVSFVIVTILNYVSGGEAFTAAEFNLTKINGFILGQVGPGSNSLGVPLFPVVDGGKVKLFQFVGGAPTEIPTTNNLNAAVPALLYAT